MSKKSLKEEYNSARKNYRGALRWLREAILYKNTVTEAWDSGAVDELQVDAEKFYKETVADIFHWRKQVERLKKALMDYKEENKKNE